MQQLETASSKWRQVIDGLHDGTEKLSHTSLWEFRKSPLHFMQYKTGEKKRTDSMIFGSVVHCLILEPQEFEMRYALEPDEAPRRPSITQINAKKPSESTLESIAFWDDFNRRNKGKEIISSDDFLKAKIIAEAVGKNASSAWVMERITETECPIEWEFSNMNWRGYQDGRGDGIICDLKILADASPRKVERAILYEGYSWQAAHYTQGAGFQDHEYYLIACDHIGHVSVFNIRRNTILSAWEDIGWCVSSFKKCLFLNQWNKSYDYWARNGGIFEI